MGRVRGLDKMRDEMVLEGLAGGMMGAGTWTPVAFTRDRVYLGGSWRRKSTGLGAFRHGLMIGVHQIQMGNGVHQLVSRLPWVWMVDSRRWGPTGHGTWLAESRRRAPTGQSESPARRPIDALRAVQQWFPGPKKGLVVFRHSVISVHRLLCFRLRS